MAISRRTLGLGLVGLSVAGTGVALYERDNPALRGAFGTATKLFGFVGGEKERFINDPGVVAGLRDRGLVLDARRAGSIEMTREHTLIDQHPQFLWPSSSNLVDLARMNGVPIRQDQVILNSPIVVYSWDNIADGLAAGGFVQAAGAQRYTLDLAKLLGAILDGKSWADVGVPSLFGHARLLSTDPNRSNSGFMFAGLAANLLTGEVATEASLDKVAAPLKTLFSRMGYKPSSSGKMFEDYIAGGFGAQPLVVGYENQLVEWVLEDEARWTRLEAAASARPVILYPRPTVYAAHPLIVSSEAALPLVDVLMGADLQKIAWSRHGFRGPLGLSGDSDNPLVATRIMPKIDAVVPMPDIATMLALVGRLSA